MADPTYCPACHHPRLAHSRDGCISVAGPPRGPRCECTITYMELSPRAVRPAVPTTDSGNTNEVA